MKIIMQHYQCLPTCSKGCVKHIGLRMREYFHNGVVCVSKIRTAQQQADNFLLNQYQKSIS